MRSIKRISTLLALIIFSTVNLFATEYYFDPVNGSLGNDGSKGSPWGKFETLPYLMKSFKPGDVLYLLSGAHGEPSISTSNSDYVTVKALEGETPVISSILLKSGKYWAFDGITFSADGSGGAFTRPYIIEAKENFSNLKITNCTIQSADDISTWTKSDWYTYAKDGLMLFSDNVILKNNTIKNTMFSLEVVGDYYEVKNNLIDNFGGDAIRALGNHAVYEGNTIRDAYVQDYAVNHDDAIQMYDRYDVYNGVLDDLVFRNNKIYSFLDPITDFIKDNDLVGYYMQSIIVTDGNITNSIFENNLIVSDHRHGITLSGAKNCLVQNNTVVKSPYNASKDLNSAPIIWLLNSKNGTTTEGCTIRNNLASDYAFAFNDTKNSTETNTTVGRTALTSYYNDYANFDFTLKSTSSAIDTGTNTDVAIFDNDWLPRVSNGTVDLGAFEFQHVADNDAPTLVGADDTDVINEVVVVFGEVITMSSAENTSNYSVSDNINVISATLSEDRLSVTLQTTSLSGNVTYTLTASNISDPTGNIASSLEDTFKYTGSLALESDAVNSIDIYPNPLRSGSNFSVNTNGLSGKETQLVIYDITGQVIAREFIGSATIYQSKSNLTKGLYIISLVAGDVSISQKLIVQ
ncbi:MAG: T9SS type A sorting domain-containing protein [Bacteroidota bacterium]